MNNYYFGLMANVGAILFSAVLDMIQRPILNKLTKLERHVSLENHERSFMIKLYLFLLLNQFGVLFSRVMIDFI